MIIWDRNTIYTMWYFQFKPCEKLYQNGLILHLLRQNQDFHFKNECVYTLTNLAYLINKQFHTSINLRKVRKSSEISGGAVLYFTPVRCGAVQGCSNSH